MIVEVVQVRFHSRAAIFVMMVHKIQGRQGQGGRGGMAEGKLRDTTYLSTIERLSAFESLQRGARPPGLRVLELSGAPRPGPPAATRGDGRA